MESSGSREDRVATDGSDEWVRPSLFVVAILSSAFLIFLVQPMVGKRILPWFGGVPSVWTLCLAFYQTTLFLGYAYAHLLIRYVPQPFQLVVHALMVALALSVLPVLPGEAWLPTDVDSPSSDILAMLSSNVALPFLVLASTGPLVQAWFSRCYPARSPYPLYAVSNAGSFAALLAYPFLLEPRLSLSTTGELWSYAFAATVAAVLGCGLVARFRSARTRDSASSHGGEGGFSRSSVAHVALWFLLPGCAVILLMGVTNSVCLDIASIPFLWILPLATYLLTFVLGFASERLYRPAPCAIATILAAISTLGLPLLDEWGLAPKGTLLHSVYVQIPGYCLLVFGACMILHGELYRLRPPPRALTAYYLCIAAGGAVGGLFVGLLAPLLFDGYYEVRVGLGLAAVLFVAASALRPGPSAPERFRGRRWKPALPLGLALVMVLLWSRAEPSHSERFRERNFFGVLRVSDAQGRVTPQRFLTSGTTLHGMQFTVPDGRRTPTSYYGKVTGIGLALSQRAADEAMRVGVIGLGIGTLAAYGREGDHFRFYEIDPAVLHLARDAGYFTFLKDGRAETQVILGDARLSIAGEQKRTGSQQYDFLVLDAFSSDAIPIHLLTLEAFRLYVASLAPDGVIAMHLSNRHFDLMPLVARSGFEVGLGTLDVRTARAPERASEASHWVLMSRSPERLRDLSKGLATRAATLRLQPRHLVLQQPTESDVEHVVPWTDDFSDLFGVLRRR